MEGANGLKYKPGLIVAFNWKSDVNNNKPMFEIITKRRVQKASLGFLFLRFSVGCCLFKKCNLIYNTSAIISDNIQG